MVNHPKCSHRNARIGRFAADLGWAVFVSLAGFGVLSLGEEVWDLMSSRPLTATLYASSSGKPVRVRGLFDRQIEPNFHKACYRPIWSSWYREIVFGERCRQLRFDPHSLRDMYTSRVPLTISGSAEEILREFVSSHSNCIALEEKEDELLIIEAKGSILQHTDGTLACP